MKTEQTVFQIPDDDAEFVVVVGNLALHGFRFTVGEILITVEPCKNPVSAARLSALIKFYGLNSP